MLGRNSKTDCIGNPLPQRSRGALHPDGGVELRVTGGLGTFAAEGLEVIHAEGEARQMQPSIQEHGTMAAGQDKSVAVQPTGLGGVHLQHVAVQHSTDLCTTNRQTHVAGGLIEDGIDGQAARFIGCLL